MAEGNKNSKPPKSKGPPGGGGGGNGGPQNGQQPPQLYHYFPNTLYDFRSALPQEADPNAPPQFNLAAMIPSTDLWYSLASRICQH